MNGRGARLIYLIGSSGAGKDTVLRWLSVHQSRPIRLHIARRTITRPADDPSESHEAVTPEQFDAQLHAGAFALHWDANGLRYGIRREELLPLTDGRNVIVNGSRGHLHEARKLYPDLYAVLLTTSATQLRQRLVERGRESEEMIDARLQRTASLPAPQVEAEIANDGAPEQAGGRLLALLGLR